MQRKVDPSKYAAIKGLFFGEEDEDAYPEFVYDAGVWNGAETEEASMGVGVSLGGKIGTYQSNTNNCIIRLPYAGAICAYYLDLAPQKRLVKFLEDFWSPDYTEIEVNGREIRYCCSADARSSLKTWFAQGKEELIKIAETAIRVGKGKPIEWHFRHASVLRAVKRVIDGAGLDGITFKHTSHVGLA